ncbi:MAG: HepT-like ribonuclease domain-containing protein [Acidimicrobiales bacterium]
MTRRDQERLSDIEDAIEAISDYVANGDLHDGVVYDACRARLMEIGEAVKYIDPELLAAETDVAWNQIARMRDILVHHYHDTDFAVVETVIVE